MGLHGLHTLYKVKIMQLHTAWFILLVQVLSPLCRALHLHCIEHFVVYNIDMLNAGPSPHLSLMQGTVPMDSLYKTIVIIIMMMTQ